MASPDDAALDALARALAPRILREVRALIEAERVDGDDGLDPAYVAKFAERVAAARQKEAAKALKRRLKTRRP